VGNNAFIAAKTEKGPSANQGGQKAHTTRRISGAATAPISLKTTMTAVTTGTHDGARPQWRSFKT
jgi:hypothetical protein